MPVPEWLRLKMSKELIEELGISDPEVKVVLELNVQPAQVAGYFAENFGARIVEVSQFTNRITIMVDSNLVPTIAALDFVKKAWHVPGVELLNAQLVRGMPAKILAGREIAALGLDAVFLEEAEKHIRADELRALGLRARNIGIVDSGVNFEAVQRSFVGDGRDYIGHGSAVAAIAKNISGAEVISAKVFNRDATAPVDIIMQGMEWCAVQGAGVINLSLGGAAPYGPMRSLIAALEANGITTVAAAGNSGCCATINYPAGYPETVAVGGVAVRSPYENARAEFSSTGPAGNFIKPDVCAPSGSNEEVIYIPELDVGVAGTSFAAPFVSGVLAVIKEAKGAMSRGEIEAALAAGRRKSNYCGFGVLDALKAYEAPRTALALAQVEKPKVAPLLAVGGIVVIGGLIYGM